MNVDNEVWKDIPGYNGAYQVSNHGNVFVRESYVMLGGRRIRKVPHFLMQSNNGNGYLLVTISYQRVRKNHYIHKLVASAFIENPYGKPDVNHINGKKYDNRACNLEWSTKTENTQHAIRMELIKTGGDVVNAIKVINIDTNKVYGCIKEAAADNNLNYGTLKDAFRRKEVYRNLKKISIKNGGRQTAQLDIFKSA